MKKRLISAVICTAIPLLMMTACSNNGTNDNNLTDTQNMRYKPVRYGYNNVQQQPGTPETKIITRRFIAPIDPTSGLREYTGMNPGKEFTPFDGGNNNNYAGGNQNQPTQEPAKPNQQPKGNTQASSGYVQQVIDLTNQERKKNGLGALKGDNELSNVAQVKSEDMMNKNYFSHTSPTYGSPFEMMQNFGIEYSRAEENIAMGQDTPKEVVDAWMKSPGHRKNILNRQITHIGVGIAKDGSRGIYWTQMFIAK